jgi:hypothetical protein
MKKSVKKSLPKKKGNAKKIIAGAAITGLLGTALLAAHKYKLVDKLSQNLKERQAKSQGKSKIYYQEPLQMESI